MPLSTEQRQQAEARLRDFAEKRINAAHYDDCTHRFDLLRCACGGLELEPAIERHPGDRPGDFKGVLWTTCADCRERRAALGVTALEPPPTSSLEHPVCSCGGRSFIIGNCERWEDWGFFDEGTVVARCCGCGELRALVDTD